MTDKNEYLVTFSGIEPGNHGFYVITYPYEDHLCGQIKGSITVNLDCCAVKNPERGVTLVAEGLYHKRAGWQAKRISRIATPADLAESKKKKRRN